LVVLCQTKNQVPKSKQKKWIMWYDRQNAFTKDKAWGFSQKAWGFTQKAWGFTQKAWGFTQKKEKGLDFSVLKSCLEFTKYYYYLRWKTFYLLIAIFC